MAVIKLSSSVTKQKTARCIICTRQRLLTALSAGLRDAEGHQRFACDEHFSNMSTVILGWADFAAVQRQRWMSMHEGQGHESPLY